MDAFAEDTGVIGSAPPRRYLWTDAYAVCNFLGLWRSTGDVAYLDWAKRLIHQVHHTLGRHRGDDPRQGWISRLSDEEGERHPTRRGLRIGKKKNERGPNDPYDPQDEWDRDGQYFHYLTKWIYALNRVAQETGEHCYLEWAVELADVAHLAFVYDVGDQHPQRIVWKMSIDLSRPLVTAMGQHDPLDGLITYLELQQRPGLTEEQSALFPPAISDFEKLCARGNWVTDDPLGVGGLLDTAARLMKCDALQQQDYRKLLARLLRNSDSSLRAFCQSPVLRLPVNQRLAFRELGLSIGLRGLASCVSWISDDPISSSLARQLLAYIDVAEAIESFWSQSDHRHSQLWTDHQDINNVMLATSLEIGGYYGLPG